MSKPRVSFEQAIIHQVCVLRFFFYSR